MKVPWKLRAYTLERATMARQNVGSDTKPLETFPNVNPPEIGFVSPILNSAHIRRDQEFPWVAGVKLAYPGLRFRRSQDGAKQDYPSYPEGSKLLGDGRNRDQLQIFLLASFRKRRLGRGQSTTHQPHWVRFAFSLK